MTVSLRGEWDEETFCPKPKCQATFVNRTRVWAGPEVFHLRLGVDKINNYRGYLGGVVGGFERKYVWDLYVNVNGSYALGRLNGQSSRSRFVHDMFVEGLFGGSIPLTACHNLLFTPYLGFGYTHVIQHLRASGLPSLNFKYSKYYLPLGFIFDYMPISWVNVGLDFKWMPQIDPTLKVVDLSGGRWELAYKQGFFVKLPIEFIFKKHERYFWNVGVVPFFRWMKDGQTQAVTNNGTRLAIPENQYTYWGGQVTFAINF